jgi:hypothetical protein
MLEPPRCGHAPAARLPHGSRQVGWELKVREPQISGGCFQAKELDRGDYPAGSQTSIPRAQDRVIRKDQLGSDMSRSKPARGTPCSIFLVFQSSSHPALSEDEPNCCIWAALSTSKGQWVRPAPTANVQHITNTIITLGTRWPRTQIHLAVTSHMAQRSRSPSPLRPRLVPTMATWTRSPGL